MALSQGWYLPEAAHPYYVLSPHFTIDFGAPGGPNPTMDLSSENVNTVPMATYSHAYTICFSNIKTMKNVSASSRIRRPSLFSRMQRNCVMSISMTM